MKVTVSKGEESHDYNITLPETIYGGTVDAVTGVGEKTWEFVEFDGTESWYVYKTPKPATTTFFSYIGVELYAGYINILCDRASFLFNTWSKDEPWAIGTSRATDACYFTTPNDVASTVDEWKAYLTAQASAGTPVQVAYKLATPTPFEISKISIPSLGSENTFFTNGEKLDIIYKVSYFWG